MLIKKINSTKNINFFLLAFLLVSVFVTFLPRTNYNAGNIFFGGVPKLYNVKLAQLFFERASYPLFGNAYPYAHHQLSRTYFIQGDLETALDEAYKELEIYPEDKGTYYVLALTLGYMNREQEAIDAFSEYIKYNPKTWAARNDKAWLQFRIGDIDGAIDTLKPIVEAQEHNVWVQNTYCALMINKKDYEAAKISCDRAEKVANIMTESSWGRAYPGNDPRIYATGLKAMKTSIAENQKLLEGK